MNILEARRVFFAYQTDNPVLINVNFQAKEGDLIGILGANGAGKTTLLKLLTNILKPVSGTVFFKNMPIKSIKPNGLYSQIGFVFQNPVHQLFGFSVEEDVGFGPVNMGLGKDEVERRTMEALRLVGLMGCQKRSIRSLSFGEQKRACIAGMLAMMPKILILDEPTQGLDPQGEVQICGLLHKLSKKTGITIIVTMHNVDLAARFLKTVYILKDGQVIASGQLKEVFRREKDLLQARLRIPYVARLFHYLEKRSRWLLKDDAPLTLKEARKAINQALWQR